MGAKIGSTINEFNGLARAGYAVHCSAGWSCNAFMLTEKCQPLLNANN